MKSKENFFPQRPELKPRIYAYLDSNPLYEGLLKVGYTGTGDVKHRIEQQYPTLKPGHPPYQILLDESAVRDDGTTFTDHEVHRMLRKMGVENPEGEWFRCDLKSVKTAIANVKTGKKSLDNRFATFKMRPEQKRAVDLTSDYFTKYSTDNPDHTPHYLWNCKMRFGKTFATYELAKRMGWKKLLVLTFKPAVEDAWQEDLEDHVDFEGWQFISSNPDKHEEYLTYETADKSRPIVCFGSFQDYLGKNSAGGIKAKNEWVHATNWDCVVLDEYHYGAWDDNAKKLFGDDEEWKERAEDVGDDQKYFEEDLMPITTNAYLYLSGTPFRALNSGEFIEEQIFNWTYSDEQSAKDSWDDTQGENPYLALPRMILMTYQLPEEIRRVAMQGEFNEFDLNVFFSAEGEDDEAHFIYEDEVQKWLDLIRGSYKEETTSVLKMDKDKPPMPFSHAPLLKTLTHTLWLFHNVSSCYAMRNLLSEPQNVFYHDYKVVVAAGSGSGIGKRALEPVKKAMGNPLSTKTITLSCGKLTTGVTVRPWTGIFMLCNLSSPETYFQSAFRVQSPWVIDNPDQLHPNRKQIMKEVCYVLDFAPNRALRQIAHYSEELNTSEPNLEKKVAEFIRFLPVLAYDGFSMKRIDPAGVLDMAMTGSTATLLARRWQSALLVNVDNETLRRLMNNEKAMQALMNIEAFRSLNNDIETIINKSEAVKKAKKEANKKDLTPEEKHELTDEEKEYKSKRKEIQEKLIKFATRIPVFMYLTDYREMCLKDVITKLEPGLFKKVTGLSVDDFDLLVSLGVFNGPKMNEAVFNFKRYEDASLSYTGIDKHLEDKQVGGFDTSITKEEYNKTFVNEDISEYHKEESPQKEMFEGISEPSTKENTLYLPIKQTFFDQIVAGTKTIEYREVKDTTARRLLLFDRDGEPMKNPTCTNPNKKYYLDDYNDGNYMFLPRRYKYLALAVGYSKDRDTALVEVTDITFHAEQIRKNLFAYWVEEFHLGSVVDVKRKKS